MNKGEERKVVGHEHCPWCADYRLEDGHKARKRNADATADATAGKVAETIGSLVVFGILGYILLSWTEDVLRIVGIGVWAVIREILRVCGILA